MSIYEFDEEREMKLIREDEREIGREEGKEIGREEGKEIGREESRELYKRLKADGRTEDLMKAIDDKAYQEQLMKEYGL